MRLPIEDILPSLLNALRQQGRAVLQAPPGAGKTTRVPLALLETGASPGRILMLEPRRLATRAAAERMAETLGEKPGQTIGYRMRGDSAIGKTTRVEVVTEGILTRMLQDAPDLPGIGTVIFDEFHERSLNADLGLALTWEVRQALRPDLRILVMSATLDAAPVAELLDKAPLISSAGQAFPIETIWRSRPPPKEARFEAILADLIRQALSETGGGVLAFLPGEGEIRRTASLLAPHLPADTRLHTLYGAMKPADQRAAIHPAASGRKLVLATAIAETSLTLADITVVVDGGRARRARFDPSSGMSRLVTEPVSRAEADQRRGRAGRTAPGICYRNWTKGAEGALPAFPPAEIEAADLSGLALDLALWGSAEGLAFLTPPPDAALTGARALLHDLGALDAEGRITDHGRKLAKLPLHPRLAHMLSLGGPGSARLAALLAERDPMRGQGSDLMQRLRALTGTAPAEIDRAALTRIRAETKRLTRFEQGPAHDPAEQAALAYPDRIALRRTPDAPRYLLSGGKGATLPQTDPLAGHRLLVVTDLDGNPREARIRQALPIRESQIRSLFADRIAWQESCHWSRRDRRVLARKQERLGALVLGDRPWPDAPAEALTSAMIEGIRDLGLSALNWTKPARLLRTRIRFSGLADMSDPALLDSLEDWAAPYLTGLTSADDLTRLPVTDALTACLGRDRQMQLDRLAPASWHTPLDRRIAIDYSGDTPQVALRLQEVFGTTEHPKIGPNRLPLKVTLLSPAGRPIQITTDLPGFWTGSYGDVRKDMRARYPKHPWPEDPRQADPTLRAKRKP
ncbi:ATP-dependent helicase HrpB [Rhodophyticola sp. CCM32]|uniref:ATP-dependent helicase HrpB n=1 Tax=Rhodophyticola sp. CCM32 TaxID=2916397 RepID=UPI00107F0B8F|nr:ATP-dependent helicase HrpB [Rhodophyticola sp. CCM32]QBY00838.1 ATP-dependent helicase HrpB [Rhodophyticola sp. CCM32]